MNRMVLTKVPSGVKISAIEFALQFNKIHPNLILLDSYENMKIQVRVKDILGIIYLCRPQDLLLDKKPTIQSAEDKNKAFKIKSKARHGNNYLYDKLNYKNAKTPVILTCPIHGDWNCCPYTHLNLGHGCHLCGKISSENKRKNNPKGWGLISWKKQAKESKLFQGFKLYIIQCWDGEEDFFKIGRTYVGIKRRFEDKNKMPYKWQTILVFESNAEIIYNLENLIKMKLNKHRYIPNHLFAGSRECFKMIDVAYFGMLISILREVDEGKLTSPYLNTIIDKVFNAYEEVEA